MRHIRLLDCIFLLSDYRNIEYRTSELKTLSYIRLSPQSKPQSIGLSYIGPGLTKNYRLPSPAPIITILFSRWFLLKCLLTTFLFTILLGYQLNFLFFISFHWNSKYCIFIHLSLTAEFSDMYRSHRSIGRIFSYWLPNFILLPLLLSPFASQTEDKCPEGR